MTVYYSINFFIKWP